MPSGFPLLEFLNAVYKHRLIVVCTLMVGLPLTVITVRALPNVYRSTTLIMVEPQDIPETYVRATVTTRLEKRLQAMNQEVLSRTRLEGIIKDFNMFEAERQQGIPMEGLVDRIRRRVKVEVFAPDNAFRISFDGGDPRMVQQVTARIAGMYIDENLRIREEHATGTTEFLEGELNKGKRQLEDQEAAIQVFKQKYMGELPEQRATNMQALESSARQLEGVSAALSAAMERKLILDRQASEVRSFRSQEGTADVSANAGSPTMRLRQLETQLSDLRSRYTREHPDVMLTENQIARLHQEIGANPSRDEPGVDPSLPPDLAQAINQSRLDIKRMKQDEERLQRAIEEYRRRVDVSFIHEQQQKDLTRDYDVTHGKYQRLLDKKLEAQLSQSLERRQKAERFRILDPASLPQAPIKPDRQLLTLAGAALSLAFGLGIPIFLWRIDTSYHSAEELSGSTLPVLAVIPQVYTADVDRRRRRYRATVLAASAAAFIIGLGASTMVTTFF